MLEELITWTQKSDIDLTHSHTMTPFDAPGNKPFENTVGKGSQRAISPLPTMFSACSENFLIFSSNFKLSSADCFNLDQSKICSLVMG